MDRTPFSTHQLPLELFRERIPAQAPGTLLLWILQRSRRKTRTLHQDMLAFWFLGPIRAKESKRSWRTHVPATIHLWVLGSSFQVPDPRSRIQVRGSGYPPYMEVKSNSSTKKQAPTALLPLFPATNHDISLKEIKAFYPLQTPGETQDPCLSKSPRLHPSTSCKKREFPVKESRIRQSTWK